MIAVSSFKPFVESPEIAHNQARAFDSWLPVFDEVVYFGSPELRLSSPKTTFVACPERPTIRLLMQLASLATTPACLINADIVLGKEARRVLHGALNKADAAMSFRFEFVADTRKARRVDNGLDLFLARPFVWRRCWPCVPYEFRIGVPVWDSWLNAWLRDECRLRYADMTTHKFVFHPRHSRP